MDPQGSLGIHDIIRANGPDLFTVASSSLEKFLDGSGFGLFGRIFLQIRLQIREFNMIF